MGFHGWDEFIPKGAIYMVSSFYFLLGLFFQLTVFFSQATLLNFFWATLDCIFFWQLLPTPPTYLLPSFPPIHLPPSSCFLCLIPSFSTHLHTQCLRNMDNLNLHQGLVHKALSFHNFWLAKRTFKSVERRTTYRACRGNDLECMQKRRP